MGSDSAEGWGTIQTRLTKALKRRVTLAYEVTEPQGEPAIFVKRFWSNFYRTRLTHTMRNAMTKLLLAATVQASGVCAGPHFFLSRQGMPSPRLSRHRRRSDAVYGPSMRRVSRVDPRRILMLLEIAHPGSYELTCNRHRHHRPRLRSARYLAVSRRARRSRLFRRALAGARTELVRV